MKRIWLIILASFFLAACGNLQMSGGNNNGSVTPASSDNLKVGDMVVARWSNGTYYEGKVDKLDGSKITVAWLDKSNPTYVDAVDVYPVPKQGAKPDVKAGEMVLAKTAAGAYWNGAEVSSVDNGVYKVRAVTGDTVVNVQPEMIIKVPAAAAADFKEQSGATDFLKEAKKGKPTVPAGYKPKKGDRVIAEWALNDWWTGRIDSISGSNVFIAWEDGSKPSAVDASKVMPLPTAQSKERPAANQYLLIKPDSGSRWNYAQTASASGAGVQAKLPNNQTKTVKVGEFIVLN